MACDLSLSNGGCDGLSYCHYNYTGEKASYLCQKYQQIGEVCDTQRHCSSDLVCNGHKGKGVCIKPFSIAEVSIFL
jgi:hypothetical protein